jgi:hypothetical protein
MGEVRTNPKLRIKHLKEKKIEALLVEGYQATKDEALEISQEFEAIDIGNWDGY